MSKGSYITRVPLVVPSAQIWLDANDPAGNGTKPSGGASLSNWIDKSGLGNNFSQASGAIQPVFNTNIRNGLPAITFNGSTQYMSCANSVNNQFANSQDLSVFAVVLTNNAVSNFIIAKGQFPSGGWGSYCNASARYGFVATNVAQFEDAATLFTASAFQIYTVVFNSAAGSATFYKNGGSASVVTGATGSMANTSNITLGVDNDLVRFWNGYIAELIVYKRNVGSTSVDLVNGYLRNKWGI